MEKELFITTLKDKVKASDNNAQIDNLSERTISEVATMFLPQFADDEKITDASWTLPVQMLKTMSGQLRHDTSEGINAFKTKFETENKTTQQKAIDDAVAAFKAQWEKDHPSQKPQQQEDNIDQKIADAIAKAVGGLTGDEGAIGKLSKQFGDYLALQAEKEKKQTEEGIRQQVREYLLGRGVDEEDFALDYTMEKLVIGENPDINALKTKAEKDYETNYKKIHKNDEAHPFNGGAGGGQETSSAESWLKNRGNVAEQEAKAAEERKKLLK